MSDPRVRARGLLEEWLDDHQAEDFRKHGFFYVRVRRYLFTRTYRIEPRDSDNIVLCTKRSRREIWRYCVHFQPEWWCLPLYDLMLAQKVRLEAGPRSAREFFRRSNNMTLTSFGLSGILICTVFLTGAIIAGSALLGALAFVWFITGVVLLAKGVSFVID